MHVDDILITSSHLCDVSELKPFLSKEFDIKGLESCQEDSWDGDSHGQELQTTMALTTWLC